MRVDQLTGAALDWAVAKCEGYTCLHKTEGRMPHEPQLAMWPPRKAYGLVELWELGYSTDWSLAGEIIEREKIELFMRDEKWFAYSSLSTPEDFYGETPLIAAMRCYVASVLGAEIDVPVELTKGE